MTKCFVVFTAKNTVCYVLVQSASSLVQIGIQQIHESTYSGFMILGLSALQYINTTEGDRSTRGRTGMEFQRQTSLRATNEYIFRFVLLLYISPNPVPVISCSPTFPPVWYHRYIIFNFISQTYLQKQNSIIMRILPPHCVPNPFLYVMQWKPNTVPGRQHFALLEPNYELVNRRKFAGLIWRFPAFCRFTTYSRGGFSGNSTGHQPAAPPATTRFGTHPSQCATTPPTS